MEIITLEFESNLIIVTNQNKKIKITPFRTQEIGNFKLGVDAPKDIKVNREEVYFAKLKKLKQLNVNCVSNS